MYIKLYFFLLSSLMVFSSQSSPQTTAPNTKNHLNCKRLLRNVKKIYFDLQKTPEGVLHIKPIYFGNSCKNTIPKSFFVHEIGLSANSKSCTESVMNYNTLLYVPEPTPINVTGNAKLKYWIKDHDHFRFKIIYDDVESDVFRTNIKKNSNICGFFLNGKCIRLCTDKNLNATYIHGDDDDDDYDDDDIDEENQNLNSSFSEIKQKFTKAINNAIEIITNFWNQNVLSKSLIILICLTIISGLSLIFLEVCRCCSCCWCCCCFGSKTSRKGKYFHEKKHEFKNSEELTRFINGVCDENYDEKNNLKKNTTTTTNKNNNNFNMKEEEEEEEDKYKGKKGGGVTSATFTINFDKDEEAKIINS